MDTNGFGERLSIILADCITRIIYFVGGFLAPLAILTIILGLFARFVTPDNMDQASRIFKGLFILILHISAGCAVCSAVFGPEIYRNFSQRGCGSLQDTKAASLRRFDRD